MSPKVITCSFGWNSLGRELALMQKARCHTWGYAPEVIAEYLPIVGKFGAGDRLCTWAEGYVGSHAGRAEWDASFLSQHFLLRRCINVGGAPFAFEYLLKKKNPSIDITSVDIGNRFPKAAKVLGITILECDVETSPEVLRGYSRQFDCVTFCEIFEHLRINILETITLLRQLLVKNGILYMTTPNGLGLTAWLNYPLWGRTGLSPVTEWSRLTNIGHMGHVREYSLIEVVEVLKHCGFELESVLHRRMLKGSRLPDYLIGAATWTFPCLSDELVLVARNPD